MKHTHNNNYNNNNHHHDDYDDDDNNNERINTSVQTYLIFFLKSRKLNEI